MTLRGVTATILCGAAILLGTARPAASAEFLGVIPVPGLLELEQDLRGPIYMAVGTQNVASSSLAYDFDFAAVGDKGEANLRLAATPSDLLGYFVADAWGAFTGQTGTFLPINLRPYMGIGAGMFMVTPSGNTSSDAWLPIYAPMGVRYALPVGPVSLGAEATYFYELADFFGSRNKFDVTRMRYEATARFAALSLSAYTESGAYLSGSGLRVGFNF